MKKTIIILSVILVSVASCNSYSSDLSKVQWVPTYLDIAHKGNVQTTLLALYYGAKCSEKPGDWDIVAVTDDFNKIVKIQEALQTAELGERENECWRMHNGRMLFIDNSNRGFILEVDPDDMSKSALFCGGSSEKLYEIIEDQNSWDSIFDLRDEIGLNDMGISDIKWFPTFRDFTCKKTEDIKMLVFLEDDANKPENCTELGRVTDPQKIKEFMKVLDENIKDPEGWEGKMIKMATINKKNQGLIRKMAWSYTNKRVLSYQHYSERAFKILEELKIIDNEKKP